MTIPVIVPEDLNRDGDLDEKRTWTDAEKREILQIAREHVACSDPSRLI